MHIVFGGSFNPPTIAHYKIVLTLLEKFKEAKILILPVGDDYQKPELIGIDHRLIMLHLLFDEQSEVVILENEKKRSYLGSLATLKELNTMYDKLYFVIGSDHLETLDQWIDYQELLSSYPFIVINRNSFTTIEQAETRYKNLKHEFIFIEFDSTISSTKIRNEMDKHQSSLTKEVYQYIKKHHLYKESKHV